MPLYLFIKVSLAETILRKTKCRSRSSHVFACGKLVACSLQWYMTYTLNCGLMHKVVLYVHMHPLFTMRKKSNIYGSHTPVSVLWSHYHIGDVMNDIFVLLFWICVESMSSGLFWKTVLLWQYIFLELIHSKYLSHQPSQIWFAFRICLQNIQLCMTHIIH